MQVDVNTSVAFHASEPQVLFKLPSGANNFDVTVDGNRFLVGIPVEQDAQTPFTVALGWEHGFKK